ncbi:uncharacterized protein LOC134538154 [Bacillus rossius redtenbacheri]|uniref:uncharacterized protein LOC134538154 n=1 Tax=Bacillus rossius redtenbacheri TaxID=93214 RepID=UPI002FDE928C
MKWLAVVLAVLAVVAAARAEGEVWEEDDHEVLIRSERGAKSRAEPKEGSKSRDPCRYVKGAWSDCDSKTNMRTRTLTLKKGDQATCEPTKTIQKKCKKACRYEKGTWTECSSESQMTRTDSLKPNSDPSCEQSRLITKKCKNKAAKNNNKGGRRNRQ